VGLLAPVVVYTVFRSKGEIIKPIDICRVSHISLSDFKEYPISNIMRQQESLMIKENLLPIFKLAEDQIAFKGTGRITSSVLSLNPDLVKILNSYIDKNGISHKGVGYYELNFLFKNLIEKSRSNIICFNSFRDNKISKETLKFNIEQTDKDWLVSMLNAFQSYKAPGGLTDSTLIELNEKILMWKERFFKPNGEKRLFSNGPDLKQYKDGSTVYEDGGLARLLDSATLDVFGRFTYDKMITGTLFYDGRSVDFITPSWDNFIKAFKHNQRLSLEHYTRTKGGWPPARPTKAITMTGALGFVVDSIIFGLSRKLMIKEELEGLDTEIILRTPHIPTDYWNPNYIRDFDVLRINKELLMDYTSKLSYWLSEILNYNPIVSIKDNKNKIEVTRILLNILFNKFKEKVNLDFESSVDSKMSKEQYLYFVEEGLYKTLFLGKHAGYEEIRRNIKDFLTGDLKRLPIQTQELLELDYIPDYLKSITLDQSDIIQWNKEGLLEKFLWALRTKTIKAIDLSPQNVIEALKEPISRFGLSFKNLAKRYGNNNKKLYIIPLDTYIHGIGQPFGHQSKYIRSASDTIVIDSQSWNCWELDGTSKTNLINFQTKYKEVLWSLLEGRCNIFIYSKDVNTGELTPIGGLNMINGVLEPDSVRFSTDPNTKTLRSFNTFDSEFYNENADYNIRSVMYLFKLSSLYLVPRKDDSSASWFNFRF